MVNLKFYACGILIVAALLFISSVQTDAKIALNPESLIVAGMAEVISDNDGFPGSSTVANPRGMCLFSNSTTEDMLIIATVNRFRVLNHTNYLGTWFGKDPAPGTENNDGPISEVYLSNPKGCTRLIHSTSPEKKTTYYVTGDQYVRWVDNDVVYSKLLEGAISLEGIAIYGSNLFVIELTKNWMFRCDIRSEKLPPGDCTKLGLEGLPLDRPSGRSIAVTNDGIFVSFNKGLNWYDNEGKLLNSNTELPIRGVAHDPYSNTLWVATSSAVHNMSVAPLEKRMHFDLFAGKEDESCVVTDNKDGVKPTFCLIDHLYAKSPDEIYLSFSSVNIVRAVVLPPKVVEIIFEGKPFPINMTGAEADLNKLYDLLDNSLNSKLKTSGTHVNRTDCNVLNNWTTKLNLIIKQREFDDERTESEIRKMSFPELISALDAYYNNTDQVVYCDVTLLPVCNTSIMDTIEHAITNHTRKLLKYNLIYADLFQTVPMNDTRNITFVKLLMPASFENQTTRDLFSNAQFPELLLKVMQDTYPSDHKYTVKLPMEIYNFEKLSPYLEQQARLKILNITEARLRQCESQTTRVNGNAPSFSSPQFSCVPRVSISNRTLVPKVDYPSGINEFETFIPESRSYSFSIIKCLDETNWDELRFWIDNTTIVKQHSQCGTGCIVGIAVGVAVFVAIIIILVVVLVSKRRRLATVLVPKTSNVLNKKVFIEELR